MIWYWVIPLGPCCHFAYFLLNWIKFKSFVKSLMLNHFLCNVYYYSFLTLLSNPQWYQSPTTLCVEALSQALWPTLYFFFLFYFLLLIFIFPTCLVFKFSSCKASNINRFCSSYLFFNTHLNNCILYYFYYYIYSNFCFCRLQSCVSRNFAFALYACLLCVCVFFFLLEYMLRTSWTMFKLWNLEFIYIDIWFCTYTFI